jgi:hypothetical protein
VFSTKQSKNEAKQKYTTSESSLGWRARKLLFSSSHAIVARRQVSPESVLHSITSHHNNNATKQYQERTLPHAHNAQDPKDRLGQTAKLPCRNPAGFRLTFVKHNPAQYRGEPLSLPRQYIA